LFVIFKRAVRTAKAKQEIIENFGEINGSLEDQEGDDRKNLDDLSDTD
jgi:hypothetical protein